MLFDRLFVNAGMSCPCFQQYQESSPICQRKMFLLAVSTYVLYFGPGLYVNPIYLVPSSLRPCVLASHFLFSDTSEIVFHCKQSPYNLHAKVVGASLFLPPYV